MPVWPEGGDRLSPSALQPAEHTVGRLKMSLNAKELLAKGPRGVGGDLRAFRPSFLAASLDGLVGGMGVAGEEVCASKAISQISEARVRLT